MAAAKKKPAKKPAAKRGRGRKDTVNREEACRRFAQAYLMYGNAVRAFRESVPNSQANANTAGKEAHKLLHDERTQLHLETLRQRVAERCGATLTEWVANDLRLARSDPARLYDEHGNVLAIADIDPDTRHAIQAIDVEEEQVDTTIDGETETVTRTRVKKIKLHAKDGAQERLGKYLGAYKQDNDQQNWVSHLLGKLPAASLATLEELLRGCSGDASDGGQAAAGGSPAAAGSGH